MKIKKHILFLLFSFLGTLMAVTGQSFKKAEYFIDKDPGIGKATPLAITKIDTAYNFSIPVSSLGVGVHCIVVRGCDNSGKWSVNSSENFIVFQDSSQNLKIVSGEYYFDTDPGISKGKAFTSFTQTTEIKLDESINYGKLNQGVHTFNARFKFNNGTWSTTVGRAFNSDTSGFIPDPIQKVEYFIDNDPGFNKGKILDESLSLNNYNAQKTISINNLSVGIHNLSVRAMTSKGIWSVNSSFNFYVMANPDLAPVSQMEYVFDKDTTVRKGKILKFDSTAMTVKADKSISIAGLDTGYHKIITRAMDTLKNVSINATRKIYICDVLPDAIFTVDSVCYGDSSRFVNKTLYSDANTKYYWDVNNDGKTDFTSKNAVYKFTAAGTYNVRLIASNGGLCADTMIQKVFVDKPVTVTITADGPLTFCDGLSVNLIASTGFKKYTWSNDSIGEKAKITQSGIYYVVARNNFCSDTSNLIEVNVKPAPLKPQITAKNGAIYADIKNHIQWYETKKGKLIGDTTDILIPLLSGNYYAIASATNGCFSPPTATVAFVYDSLNCFTDFKYSIDTLNLLVTFTNLTALSTRSLWSFGDGIYSNKFAPSHKYSKTGKYQVCLTSRDTISECLKKNCHDVAVGELICSSIFAYSVNQTTRTVTFTDLSTSTTEWFWSYGDGNLAKTKNATYTYKADGLYKVCHWVRNKATGCFDQTCIDLQIGKIDTTVLTASFASFSEPNSLSIKFSNKSSKNATNYYWTFGDGEFSTSSVDIEHTYAKAGTYNVCLKVFDNTTGNIDEYCESIVVGDLSICSITADFSSIVKETREVLFYNKSIGSGNRYYWNFGDGKTATTEHASHLYANPGYYLVSLAVRNSDGTCYDYTSQLVKVGEVACKAMFDFKVDPINTNVSFTNKSTGFIKNYFWSFGNGVYSSDVNPEYHYTKEGLYKVTLTVSNELGTCMDFYTAFVQVGKINCDAKFTYYVDSLNNKVFFNDEVIGLSTNLSWSFGDGSISSRHDPNHQYRKSGYYKVGLNTFNVGDWCMDYYEETILVGSESNDCASDFIYQADDTTNLVKFYDKSNGNIIGWIWNFGDGTDPVSDKNPIYTFKKPGYYNVCHMVVTNDMLTNLKCKPVIASPAKLVNCRADFTYSVDSTNMTVYLADASEGNPTKWTWNPQNGSTYTSKVAKAVYTKPGYYLVDLKISAAGCNSRVVKMVNVSKVGSIQAGFLFQQLPKTTKAGGYPVDFVGAGSGDQARLRWDYGDGVIDSTTNTPTHEYLNTGTYHVCFEVSDPVTGQKDSACQTVVVSKVEVQESKMYANSLILYPNPVESELVINYHLIVASQVSLQITDLQGRTVRKIVNSTKSEGDHKLIYDANELAKGTYLIEMNIGGKEITTKLFIKK